MKRHTPGPWSFGKMPCGIATVAHVEDYRIGPDFGSPDMADYSDHGLGEADARLIAAAPEMAEALRRISDVCRGRHNVTSIVEEIANKALARAGL